MRLVLLPVTLIALLFGVARLQAEIPLNEARSTLEKWVETRQLVSKTQSDWQSDKEMLEQTRELLERELKSVEEQFSKLDTNSTQVNKERATAEAALKSANDSLDQSKKFASGFQTKLAGLVPQLPSPLQDIIQPKLNQLPADPADTKTPVTIRIRTLVETLNEVDKFNNSVTIFSEKRKNEKGELVAVESVYVGLGAAYFVNDANNFAGLGTPGKSGWEWTIKSELAPSVRKVIQIYRNEHPAQFVPLPVVIR